MNKPVSFRKRQPLPVCLAAFALLWPVTGHAGRLLVATGLDISRGQYGLSAPTTIQAESLQLRYENGDGLFRLDVPYLHIDSPNTVQLAQENRVFVPNTMPGTTGTQTTRQQHIEGPGDVQVGLSQLVYREKDWALNLGGRIKLPTASRAAGLGSGKADYTLQTDVYYQRAPVTYFIGAGYKWMGRPEGFAYRDVLLASGGATCRVSDSLTMGLALDYRQSVIAGLPDQKEWMLFANKRFSQHWQTQLYLYGGITRASPELGIGLTLGRFFRFSSP